MAQVDPSALNEAERAVLVLLAEGHTIKTAAAELGVTPASASERLRSARRKTGALSSRQLARVVADSGLHKSRDSKSGVAQPEPAAPSSSVPPGSPAAKRMKGWMMLLPIGLGVAIGALAFLPATPAGPPRVVSTYPADDAQVTAGPTRIAVTFDRPMRRDSYSFVTLGEGEFPVCNGKPIQSTDGRSFTQACDLLPSRHYVIGFNGGRFMNFVSAADGQPAVPAQLAFTTR